MMRRYEGRVAAVTGKAASRQRGNKERRRFIRGSGNRKTPMLGRNSNPAQRRKVTNPRKPRRSK